MKDNIKNKMFEAFEAKLAEAYPEMGESNRRNIASLMQNIAVEIIIENTDGISKAYSDAVIELEKHRNQFREHIELIQKYTKLVLESFKKNSMVTVDFDQKLKRPVLKARTTVITDTVNFLNRLNESTIEFYENVYKIESSNDFGIQTTLF